MQTEGEDRNLGNAMCTSRGAVKQVHTEFEKTKVVMNM